MNVSFVVRVVHPTDGLSEDRQSGRGNVAGYSLCSSKHTRPLLFQPCSPSIMCSAGSANKGIARLRARACAHISHKTTAQLVLRKFALDARCRALARTPVNLTGGHVPPPSASSLVKRTETQRLAASSMPLHLTTPLRGESCNGESQPYGSNVLAWPQTEGERALELADRGMLHCPLGQPKRPSLAIP